jgi:hypothetical protein
VVVALGALVLRWRERRERKAWLGPLLLVFNAFLLFVTTIGGDGSLWLWLASSMRPLLARPVRRLFASLLVLWWLRVARFPPCKVVVVGQRLAPRTDPPHAHCGKYLTQQQQRAASGGASQSKPKPKPKQRARGVRLGKV